MKSTSPNRFSGLQFKNGKTLRNRIVVPPMASETADFNGFVTENTIAHYQRLAESKAGLVFVEYTYVHKSGRSEEQQLGIQSDDYIEGLAKVAQVIHKAGAMAGLQITHAGGKTSRDLTDGVLMGPSDVAVPVKNEEMEPTEPMSQAKISLWKSWFVAAATRAVKAGFDLLEFHCAHGYGLNQWLSPITNKRTDKYGGSLENNARLLLETIQQVKATEPSLLLAVRMPGQDFFENGLMHSDTIKFAQLLEQAGTDLLDISSGIGGWRRPEHRTGEGYLVAEAQIIQANVSIPVIGVGGIKTGAYIDEALKNRALSLAAVGREIAKDPQAWAAQNILLLF